MRATRRADIRRILLASPILATVSSAGLAQADIPRLPDGKPDLSGTYDIATLTPIEPPRSFGERLLLDDEEAAAIARKQAENLAELARPGDPGRDAPPAGRRPRRRPRRACTSSPARRGTTRCRASSKRRASPRARRNSPRTSPQTRGRAT